MEFVYKLQRYQRNKRSIRKTLLEYGTKDWTNYARPMEQLSEEEITTLILNWIPKVLKQNETIKIRLRVEQKVYEVWLKCTKCVIQVKQVTEKKRSMKHLYGWKPGETFNDVLTLEDLRQRMAMADVLKKLN